MNRWTAGLIFSFLFGVVFFALYEPMQIQAQVEPDGEFRDLDASRNVTFGNYLTCSSDTQKLETDGTGALSCGTIPAAHGDGANCNAGEIALGVDAAGAVQGCYQPTEADITDLSHTTDTNANTICVGTSKYLDGEGNCDTLTATSPGGSDHDIQFNNSSAFGGESEFTYNDTTNAVSLIETMTDGTVTANDVGLTIDNVFSGFQSYTEATASYTFRIDAGTVYRGTGVKQLDFQVNGTSIISYKDSEGAMTLGADINVGAFLATGLTNLSGSVFGGDFSSFTANDVTPSVTNKWKKITANSTPMKTITDFDDGVPGQEILIVVADAFTTLGCSGAALTCNGGADYVATSGDAFRCTANVNATVWYCAIIQV